MKLMKENEGKQLCFREVKVEWQRLTDKENRIDFLILAKQNAAQQITLLSLKVT